MVRTEDFVETEDFYENNFEEFAKLVKDFRNILNKNPQPEVKEENIEEDVIDEPQFNSGFYRDDDGRLLIVDRDGKYVKLDFDVDKLLEK